jgi:hypothetical protein
LFTILATAGVWKRLKSMRLVMAAVAVWAAAAQDPRALMEKSLQRDQRDDELARQYAYLETSTEQEWKNGQKTKQKTETHEIMSLYGQPYRRLVARDGKPLGEADLKKEQAKLDKLAADRAKETPVETERRVARYAEERRRQRAFLQEIPRAFTFQMAGEARVGGRDAWIIDATPLPGYRATDSRSKMLNKFKGRFFVSKEDATLLRLEAEAIEAVSFGLVLARLEKGARFSLEKTRVNNELWMPMRIKVDFDARLALLKKIKVDVQIDYSNFRKFQSESKMIAIAPLEN